MNDLVLPQELMREIALHCDSKTILILRELYPDIVTGGFFIDYLIHNGYDVHIEHVEHIWFGNYCTKWTKYGIKHNEFGPAIIRTDGHKEWWINGDLHNENGPAVIFNNGDKEWRINGLLHNENGPAIIRANGSKLWYINGKFHNEKGPAVINADGVKEWYINDKKLTENEFNNRRR